MEANEHFFRILKIMTQYRNFVSISTLYSKLFRKEFEIYSIRNVSTKASSSKFRKFKLLQIFRIKKKKFHRNGLPSLSRPVFHATRARVDRSQRHKESQRVWERHTHRMHFTHCAPIGEVTSPSYIQGAAAVTRHRDLRRRRFFRLARARKSDS